MAPSRKASPKKTARTLVGAPSKRGAGRSRPTAAPASPPVKFTTYAWRRLHDGHLIAQASPLAGMGSWRVSAYRTTNDADSAYAPGSYSLIREAQHAADELVRVHFSHTCRTGVCGRWLRWPEE
jgi:hypothetical protein